MDTPTQSDPNCICYGNWRQLVSESEKFINRWYVDSHGIKHTFIGLIHGSDDYYYGMLSENGKLGMLSCVGNIENFGFTLLS